jgi:hypothetical protein
MECDMISSSAAAAAATAAYYCLLLLLLLLLLKRHPSLFLAVAFGTDLVGGGSCQSNHKQ